MILRDGEVKIISVTPVARGTFRPCVVGIVMLALVIFGAKHVHVIHEHEMLLGLIFAGPFALVALTRTWRWRSHKVHVTNERVVVEGGVLHHYEAPSTCATSSRCESINESRSASRDGAWSSWKRTAGRS